jgi:hypothetical protein
VRAPKLFDAAVTLTRMMVVLRVPVDA